MDLGIRSVARSIVPCVDFVVAEDENTGMARRAMNCRCDDVFIFV